MKKSQSLSKGELEIVRALWEIGPATVRQIHGKVSEGREIDFATVQTYLRRLESKGYASSKLDGRVRIYSAKTKPQAVIRATVDDLVTRLFGGSAMPLVRHLIEDGDISGVEIAELRQLIDRMESTPTNQPNSPKKTGRQEPK